MVKEKEHEGKRYFMCEACNMFYKDKETAQKCETHCNEKHACNTELIKHAVQIEEEKGKTCNVNCKDNKKNKCSC